MKWIKRVRMGLVGLIGLLVVASLGFVAWAELNRYPAQLQAQTLSTANPNVTSTVVAPQSWLVFAPNQTTAIEQGFIFYPGGLVDAEAYRWLGQALAQRGILTVIVPMPLDLAIFNAQAADEVVQQYPNIHTWVIGGHSLGGSMAAQYLASHSPQADQIKGLVLWGARLIPNIDLSAEAHLKVISIYGTRDGIAPKDITVQQRLVGLPSTTQLIPITGGNHSMFGDYGLQKSDNPIEVSPDVARTQIIEATLLAYSK